MRRNITQQEVVRSQNVDLGNITRRGEENEGGPTEGGSIGEGVGVPSNFRIVSQEVIVFNGEYRVNVVLEFDGVAGANEYEPRLRQLSTGGNS